ncbi:MAG: hypothetical protein ACR2IX_05275 [Limnohabitans sp.]
MSALICRNMLKQDLRLARHTPLQPPTKGMYSRHLSACQIGQ